MPFWPFKKRRRSTAKDVHSQPLNEKASSQLATAVSRKTSERDGQRKRPASPEGIPPEADDKRQLVPDKENRPPTEQRRTSIEDDITALPVSRKLEHSPHLRPVDMERPSIPYKFRPVASSQTSLQQTETAASPRRPNTLRSKRSGHESATPQRRRSSKRRKDDHVREEEIRAMSAPIPIPKRPGEGPLGRDSKKMRGAGTIGSVVSLPHGESIHSTMSGFEQRGWEIGMLDVFNPRPAVRLSGTPQYVAPSSVPNTASSPLPESRDEKQKKRETKQSARKRETIGNRADDFDASDLRMLLERDAKRKERRKLAQQEKLDEKLRSRGGRNRGDSDKRRRDREAEEQRREDEARRRAEQEATERMLTAPPTAIHPALRDQAAETEEKNVGLGIGEDQAAGGANEPDKQVGEVEHLEEPKNPFTDDAAEQLPTPKSEELPAPPGAFGAEIETPMEDPVVDTARAVRVSQTSTPPLSPVRSSKGTLSIGQVMDPRRASDLPPPPPPITENRRASDPKPERKTGGWATLFRRGGTLARRQNEGTKSPSAASFSNTSRESMRNQPLPAHLVDPQLPAVVPQRKSGTPARTQSKFREDLPELPMSPPDSRMPSPDVAMAAASAAAARRAGKTQPMDIPGSNQDAQSSSRNDTPTSPARGHGLMSASLASIDSEGSWLASGASTKRRSTQSALSRDMGSLSRRKDFSASYEELGEDKDAEYIRKNTPSPDSKRALRGHSYSGPAMSGMSPDEESELNFDPSQGGGEPVAMHGSVRRKPTLVTRDPRVRSREGLLTEYTAESGVVETAAPASATEAEGSPVDFDLESPMPEIKSASSVNYGSKGHARQMSAGSAKLLVDVKRQSASHPPSSPADG